MFLNISGQVGFFLAEIRLRRSLSSQSHCRNSMTCFNDAVNVPDYPGCSRSIARPARSSLLAAPLRVVVAKSGWPSDFYGLYCSIKDEKTGLKKGLVGFDLGRRAGGVVVVVVR